MNSERSSLSVAVLQIIVGVLSVVLASAPSSGQRFAPSGHVHVTAVSQQTHVMPGGQFAVAVVISFDDGWHAWPNRPVIPDVLEGVLATPTTVEVDPAARNGPGVAGLRIETAWTQWPDPVEVPTSAFGGAEPVNLLSYKGTITAYVPVIVEPEAEIGERVIPLVVILQACDESQCAAPEKHALRIPITIVPIGAEIPPPSANSVGRFAEFNPAVFSRILAGETAPSAVAGSERARFDFLGYEFFVDRGAIVLVMLLAFLAGAIMNFTPCVLPVIPIKVLSLQSHAKTPGKLAYYGTVYCAGIVAAYLVLGLLAFGLITGGKKLDWGQIFTYPAFTISMAALVGVMGLGMMGLFNVRLPSFVYQFSPTGDTASGNFGMGVLTAVLAVPCTGPLLGGALAWTFTQPAGVGLGMFVVMGAGMAAPYAILILFPRLIEQIPRGGPGSELLKQVVGILMIGVAIFLLGNLTPERWPWWFVGGAGMAAGVWIVVGAWRSFRSPKARLLNTALGVVFVAGFAYMALSLTKAPPIDWRVFYNRPDAELRAAIAAEVARGKVVVVDFTAKWCTNCHVIERNILYSAGGLAALGQPDVVEFKVDLTNAEEDQGWGTVREIAGGGGIPLIAVFGPARPDKPVFFQSFFKVSDLEDAIRTARGR